MSKRQSAAVIAVGVVVLFLGLIPSRSLTQFADKPGQGNPRPVDPGEAQKDSNAARADEPEAPNPPGVPKRGGGARPKRKAARRPGPGVPEALAPLMNELDKDGDGKISLAEWQGSPQEFREADRNGDGFITPDELMQGLKGPPELKFRKGRADHNGEVIENEEPYQGRKSYKILKVRLEAGKTYQFDMTSQAFQSFLYLEGPDGQLVKENSSPDVGGKSRLVYRAGRAGDYRVIATSLGGFRVGPFSCSAQVVTPAFGMPKGLASLFKELDKDGDGQIGLYEWRGSIEDFLKYDLNGDGFITPDELLRVLKK